MVEPHRKSWDVNPTGPINWWWTDFAGPSTAVLDRPFEHIRWPTCAWSWIGALESVVQNCHGMDATCWIINSNVHVWNLKSLCCFPTDTCQLQRFQFYRWFWVSCWVLGDTSGRRFKGCIRTIMNTYSYRSKTFKIQNSDFHIFGLLVLSREPKGMGGMGLLLLVIMDHSSFPAKHH